MILKAENILVLSDIQFLTTLSNHFQVRKLLLPRRPILFLDQAITSLTLQAILGKDDAQLSLSESSVESSIMSGKVCVKEEEEERGRREEREEKRGEGEERGERGEREERGRKREKREGRERICWYVCSWLACD